MLPRTLRANPNLCALIDVASDGLSRTYFYIAMARLVRFSAVTARKEIGLHWCFLFFKFASHRLCRACEHIPLSYNACSLP